MIRNGAARLHRLLAFCLTLMMLTSACLTTAFAADIWNEVAVNILWDDGNGIMQSIPAAPVQQEGTTAFWAQMDASALGQILTVEVTGAPDHVFYMMGDNGEPTTQFIWTQDAPGLDVAYAYPLYYATVGMAEAEPVYLYVSSSPYAQESPEPEFTPFPVQVPVYYVTDTGEMLDSQVVECWAGESVPVWANSANVEGYELISVDTVEVRVDEFGIASPAEVVFTYARMATPTPEPTEEPTPTPIPEALVMVVYYHVNGEAIDYQEFMLTPGTHTITANSALVEGLVPVGETSATVTVDANGNADLVSVFFTYEDAAPAEAVLPVYYYHIDGELLDIQEVKLAPGTYTIRPQSSKVEGYQLEGASGVEVTINSDGSATLPSVQFLYKDVVKAPAKAEVTMTYFHIDGTVLDRQTITLEEGVHTVSADSDQVADYIPVGNTSVQVAVDAHGNAQPDAVEFYFEDAYVAPVQAQVTVLYQTEDGYPVAQDTVTLTPGSHTIRPNAELLKDLGYIPVGEQAELVHVDEDGRAEPTSVLFTCRNAAVKIAVHYQDDRGRSVAQSQEVTFSGDGEHVVQAAPQGLPTGYELAPGQSSAVRLTIVNGVPSKSEVYFYYQQKPTGPVLAEVTVCYYDPYGEEIAPSQTITLAPGVHQVNADSAETFRGYVLVSEPSITVEVYENGTFSPQEVAFYYRFAETEEKTADVTILFRDDRGNDVAPAQTFPLPDGEHVIEAVPVEGYTIFAGTDSKVTVTVRDGVASKSQVVFYYQKTQTQPSVFTIPVSYYDTMGLPIAATQYIQVAPGTYAVQANPADLSEGYELMMDPVLMVKVNRDGTTDPEEIAFYYRAPEKKAELAVIYADEDGNYIAQPFTMQLGTGYHTISADVRRVPEGFDPESAKAVQVYVSREGKAEPAQVVLTFERLIIETPIPVGEHVYRYAKVNSNSVAFRNEPSTDGGNKTVIKRLSRSDKVYVLQELYNDEGETWAMVNVDGRIGYMMSEFIQVMSQEESDAYAGRNTPVPTFTPDPTFTPYVTATPTLEPLPTDIPPLVEALTPPPTETPTEAPTSTASPSPAPTATPEPYQGYALTTHTTALRTGISESDMTIMHAMEANTLVRVVNQLQDPTTGEVWSIISTLNNQAGFVLDSALRYISDKEAQPYLDFWAEINREPEPTSLPTHTPEPMQLQGYGVVVGDGVPFRQMQSEFSRIIDHLDAGTMIYISGQTAGEDQYWHSVNYQGRWGYIRVDLVRMLTIAEEEAYLESLMASPTPATTNIPFDEDGLSSYGYVDGSNVNWRSGPSTGETRIGELRRYAFCLVLGTEEVNGVTWYRVKYADNTGYIHGDFFKHLTISELEDFLHSEEYLEGVVNNSPDGKEALDNVGFIGTGGLVTEEDRWVADNNDLVKNTLSPWQPIATVAPIQTAPTLEPLPGWHTAAPTATPSPTPNFNPLPDVTYPTANKGDGGSAVVWVFVLGLLLLAVGGVFALVRHQQNKRRIALRAAQRRAQAARAQQQQQRPYARTAASGQPRTGTYPAPQRPVQSDAMSQSTNTYNAYARPTYQQESYFRPAETQHKAENTYAETPSVEGTTQRSPRVGRRTAYRQAQENNQEHFED